MMNTTNIIASGDSKSVKTKESSKATRSESLEDLQRQLETYEKRAEETLSADDKPKKKLGYAISQLHWQFRATKRFQLYWQDFLWVSEELNAAEKQLGVAPDATSEDYVAKLYDKLCLPDSNSKQLVDFYNQCGLSFNDWYILWDLMEVNGALCEPRLSPDKLKEASNSYLDKGVITREQYNVIVKLVAYYNGQNFKSIDMGFWK